MGGYCFIQHNFVRLVRLKRCLSDRFFCVDLTVQSGINFVAFNIPPLNNVYIRNGVPVGAILFSLATQQPMYKFYEIVFDG